MTDRHTMAGAIALVLAFCTVLCSTQVHAQDTTIKTKQQAELLIPRPALKPVESLNNNGQVMDTLETASPYIKIILYSNYTWKYIKTDEYAADKEVFNEYWQNDTPDPYHVELSSLPDEIALWIVDTLSGYRCPHHGKTSSKFGYRHGRRHQGIDLPFETGTPVYAAFDGRVRMSGWSRGYGNLVIIRHENGLETFYAHLSKRLVNEGDWVNAGSIIGLGGSTGRSSGPHLHFETRYKGYAFDPEWLIDFETGNLRHRLFVLKKKYLSPASKYVPESDEEEEEINAGDEQDRIKAEAEAKAKAEAAAKAAVRYHTIKQGDTLGAIARKYHTTVRRLCQLNNIKETTTLRLGRKLRVN